VVLARLLSRSGMLAPGVASGAGSDRRVRNLNVLATLRDSLVRPSRLLRIFVSLVGTQLGGGVLGLVFWTLAARALTPEQVGVGAALVAAVTLLSVFGVLGISTLLLERFKVVAVTDRRALLSTGLGIAGMGGALVAGGWVALSAPLHLSGVLGDLSPSSALLLVGTTGIAATCSAFDHAVVGMGLSHLQLRRNLIASIVRIAVLSGAIALNVRSGQIILICWTVGLVGSLLGTPLQRHLPSRARETIRQRWRLVRNHWPAAIGHHGLTLALVSSGLMLPVFVASLMPASQTAYFNQANLLGANLTGLQFYLTYALFATAENVEGFRRKAPRTLIMGMVFALFFIVTGALFGPVLLLMFGTSYSQKSWPLLLIILATGPAMVIKDHFVVLRRLQGMRRQGALTMALWSAAELTGGVVGGLVGGMTMLCLGWLAMSTACALIALPVLIRAMHRQPTGDESHRGPLVKRWTPMFIRVTQQTTSRFNTCPVTVLPYDGGKHDDERGVRRAAGDAALGAAPAQCARAQPPTNYGKTSGSMRERTTANTNSGVSVIICAYTEERWMQLTEAIESVCNQSQPAAEIVVVIDYNPALLKRVGEKFPSIAVIANAEEKGLSGARNTGIAASHAPLVGFVDDDAVIERDWIKKLGQLILQDALVMGAGGRIIPKWEAASPKWMPEEFYWVVGCTHKGVPEQTADVRNLIGANMLIRREVFERVGGFRNGIGRVDAIPLGCEETELCIRTRQAIPGARFVYDPNTVIYHSVSSNRTQWSYYRDRCYAEGISKATISKLVGQKDGLSTERTHAMITLPKGVMTGLEDTLFKGDWHGVRRAGAIVAGLMITTAGYIRG
jgi:glucosyl-dolichyl phosphate glucuronosyltransferase